mmetsp:Transcript_30/g.51  ORF Transcript_30/g.51 Transcript_30/m.51 type:complete len:215 (+) Transcript_30:102-746(+)|eukprot:scaffold2512_cov164-Amphora_coffeaeformis.AAC.9
MTLLGVPAEAGGFSLGAASPADPPTMNMSLDEMIANRRKQEKPKPKPALGKNVSNTDKAIATSRAKRSAALDARRGITKSAKPTKAAVEQEIKKQVARKSIEQAKKRIDVNADHSTKAEHRRQKRELARSGAATIVSGNKTVVGTLGRPPSKKAIRAAVDAMEAKGFKIPEGYRMVISFAPEETYDKEDTKPAAKGDGGKKGGKKQPGKKGGKN